MTKAHPYDKLGVKRTQIAFFSRILIFCKTLCNQHDALKYNRYNVYDYDYVIRKSEPTS